MPDALKSLVFASVLAALVGTLDLLVVVPWAMRTTLVGPGRAEAGLLVGAVSLLVLAPLPGVAAGFGAWFPLRAGLRTGHLVTLAFAGVLGLASPLAIMALTGEVFPVLPWLAITAVVPWCVALWLVPARPTPPGMAR